MTRKKGPEEAARNCWEAPTTCRNPASGGGTAPHAELESGASVGTSDLEVKTTTRVRGAPRTRHFRPILAKFPLGGRFAASGLARQPLPARVWYDELQSRDGCGHHPGRRALDPHGPIEGDAGNPGRHDLRGSFAPGACGRRCGRP